MKKTSAPIWITFMIVVYAAAFIGSVYINASSKDPVYMTDVSRLLKVPVYKIVKVKDTEDIREALEEAKSKNLAISMTGMGHSQGGHIFYRDAIVLDMKKYNRIISLDVKNKIIRVQSGVTWEQIQNAINPHHLSVRVMQSSNIFTVGGSLSSNVHGRDTHEESLIDTVQSFRLMTAEGNIIQVSRTENSRLFPLVIGGFGLFGVILDVDLRLTDNVIYQVKTDFTDYRNFPEYFQKQIVEKPEVELTIGRLSTAPSAFLTEMYVTKYIKTDHPLSPELIELQGEKRVETEKFIFGLSRKFDWGKNASWLIQKKVYSAESGQWISRNNAMRPGIRFLDYHISQKTDILQEYYVPIDQFSAFVDGLRKIVREADLNLVNITVRYVREDREAYVSYAKQDSFALVLLFNVRLNKQGIEKMERATQHMVDLAIRHQSTYYLTYQLFPTKEQLMTVYPEAGRFFAEKRKVDPGELFMNEFYARYAR